MTRLDIRLDGDGCWPDLNGKGPDQVIMVDNLAIAFLAGGMSSGKPSLTLRIDLPDGRSVITQTSLELFQQAARVFGAKAAHLEQVQARGGRPS